ncbi:MAG: LytR C-terminal domain-containing protein [Acidimicrobiales bacterium]
MTAPGRHSASDGSFGKSAGSALFRGGALVAFAVILGLVLLKWGLDGDDGGAATVSTADQTSDDDATGGDGDPGTTTPAGSDGTTPPVVTEPPVTEPPDADDDGGGGIKPAGEVTVVAANGVGTSGLAGALAAELTALNYKPDPANAPAATVTKVYFRKGFRQNAREIVDNLGASPDVMVRFPNDGSVVIDNDSNGARVAAAQIIIIMGSDGVFQS